MRTFFFVVVIAAIVLVACDKDNPLTPPLPPNTTDTTASTDNKLPVAANVYIAGDTIDSSPWARRYAVYWNNGKKINLPNDTPSSATGIAVSDTNVYVSAWGVTGNKVTYWKNRTGISLSEPTVISPVSKGITVSGNDVYTVGIAYTAHYEKLVPVYWKNQNNAIKVDGPNLSDARSIAVAGNDIYIAGNTSGFATGYGFLAPCYWKNGSPIFLPSPEANVYTGVGKSIQISGSDIYVAGDVSKYPGAHVGWGVYWKNGIPVRLSGLNENSSVNGMMVVGNDVYICGEVSDHAAYWKNGVLVILDPKYVSVAYAIAVDGNGVHVVGERRGPEHAVYWKNGSTIILGRGTAKAITIKK